VPDDVMAAPKHLWSIYQKMKRTGRPFRGDPRRIGFRVITDYQSTDSSASASRISPGTPITRTVKDYIALPKPNSTSRCTPR